MEGTCWPVDICDDCCTDSMTQLSPAHREIIQQMAANLLWQATGRQYGGCPVILRPCRANCGNDAGLPSPSRASGEWLNMTCGTCSGPCGCDTVSEVVIPHTYQVLDVMIDGEYYEPEDVLAVYDYRRLVRIDGGVWPACQNLSSVDGPGTWSVTIVQGRPLPPGAEFVAGLLACELAKACTGDSGCRLPRRVQTLTRNGVTVGFSDLFEGLEDLRTGLWEVDAFIEANRSTRHEAAVISPDRPRPSRQTWPTPPRRTRIGAVIPDHGDEQGGTEIRLTGIGFKP